VAYGRWVEAERQVRKYGSIVKSPVKGFPMKSPYLSVADQAMEAMRKFMVEFGLTPSSRSRIRVPAGGDAADEFDVFLETG
jgi:P27 family predicted phage terminase small subunit